ncbi:M48 family metallopeptidase [Bowmanella yangjiangensis]|uniref:M48 family metallopeptidase n=1 Tax=Bowmanella yangjiangensis TaxID=2811230 RepID=A0ABS3CV91_9ALTE|nr:M48 family metallopeptidase [Bowmanella yangjiangensis]MBN7819549.1 M48 family metallopeptidase [Bowmanella yangjiangensis]
MRHELQGTLYPPGSSASCPVLVHLCEGELRVLVSDSWHSYTKQSVSSPAALGRMPRDIKLPDGGLLHVPASAEVNRWLDGQKLSARLAALETNRWGVIASLVLAPLFLFGLFKFGIPAMAVSFAHYVPQAYINTASEHTLLALDESILEPSQLNQATQQEYLTYWQNTVSRLGLPPSRYHIQFRHAEKLGPNAFALPNGTIVITDQMVALLEGDKQVLQAVLLHEIGHVEHRHSMRLIAQTLASSVVISYLFGDMSGMADLFAGASTTLVQNQFSQDLEWEADNYALAQLDKLGQDGESFALAMEKLASLAPASSMERWLSSHPMLKDRIDNARR